MTAEILDNIGQDLKRSGLDINDMRVRFMDAPERSACNVSAEVQGYVIPYFNIEGQPIPYYRVRLFDFHIKYKQVKNTPNHVYFPIGFKKAFLAQKDTERFILICEGEKKASLAVKLGLPAIAFGGVDSWQNKLLTIPGEAEITANSVASAGTSKKVLSIRVPDNGYAEDQLDTSLLARGFQELIDFALSYRATMIIVYDSDRGVGMKPEVQRAASRLGYELRFKGFKIGQIKQLVLPPLDALEKTALDDFIMAPEVLDSVTKQPTEQSGGVKRFVALLKEVLLKKKAFPRNPNIREHVNKRLQKSKLSRKEMQQLSLAVVTELDARGQRMYSVNSTEHYFFDGVNAKLMKAPINTLTREQLQETVFGKMLYNEFGISPSADSRVMQWLGSQFAAEDPIDSVNPHRVFARQDPMDDCVNMQINDSQFARINKEGVEIFDNGADGILFESGCVEPVEASDILMAFQTLVDTYGTDKPVENRWSQVLREVRLKDHGNAAALCALLYHISPFLFRWRGAQLPVELVIGESGSGKSTLCELRLDILTGDATLRNAPQDLKDWHASVANTGGLHVTDNVQLIDRNLQQRLSDEICRLITEPQPHIEMRKYYTNADLMRIGVNAVFAFTAIKQPFVNADLLQRAIILEFDKAPTAATTSDGQVTYDSRWRFRQVERFGGRAGWIAYHMFVLWRFFVAVEKYWNQTYKATHRLINLEQSLMILGKHVFGRGVDETAYDWVPKHLVAETNSSITEADWAFEGLCAFAREMLELVDHKVAAKDKRYSANDIASWAASQEDYLECIQITNARKLGRYLQTHKHMVASIAGIYESGTYANRTMYEVRKVSGKSTST